MNIIVGLVFGIVMLVWYIRPMYNFMAKRKYLLLDMKQLSMKGRVQTWLPSIVFYTLILAVMVYPAFANDLLSSQQTGGIFLAQVVSIFLFTRYDKWQTKYTVLDDGIRFRNRYIKWDEKYSIKFKKSAFVLLHKPRFILKSENYTLVIPMLSPNIEHFITRLSYTHKDLGKQILELYVNTKAYYVKNIFIEKELNKLGKL